MTFDRMEELRAQIITLDCAFEKYKIDNGIQITNNLLKRLALFYDTDAELEDDCLAILEGNKEILNRFNKDTKDEDIRI